MFIYHLLFSLTHGRVADGELVKNGQRGPDVVEPIVQKAIGFDLPNQPATTVGKQGMLTGPLHKLGRSTVNPRMLACEIKRDDMKKILK